MGEMRRRFENGQMQNFDADCRLAQGARYGTSPDKAASSLPWRMGAAWAPGCVSSAKHSQDAAPLLCRGSRTSGLGSKASF
jgi:hypothetical protein